MIAMMLWAAMALAPAAAGDVDAKPTCSVCDCSVCDACDCCRCCETGTCTCKKCGCDCCVDE